MSTFNPFDKYTNKEESAVLLGIYFLGGLATLYFADLATVAVGIKETLALPVEIGITVTATATALLGFILGRKSNGAVKNGNE